MVVFGTIHGRMRDFFDISMLAAFRSFDGELLANAMRSTFERRRTEIPAELPLALTRGFAEVKQAQWRA